jgi:vacuolar-type H+-ATPase subunit I/STV1
MAPYLAFIPGAEIAFDEIDAIADTHGPELDAILSDAYGDLKEVLDNGGLDKQTARAVSDIAKRLASDLKDLSMDAGEKLLEENPKLKEAMECPVLQLKELGRRYGPEAQKVVDETYKQIEDIINQGLTPESLSKASKLVEEKSAEIKELGLKAVEKALNEGSQEVKTYLDRAPQIKKLLEENVENIKEAAISGKLSVSQIPQIFQKAKDATIAIDKKTAVERLRRYLEDLTGKGKGKIAEGGENLQRVAKITRDYVKSFPWGEEVGCSCNNAFRLALIKNLGFGADA